MIEQYIPNNIIYTSVSSQFRSQVPQRQLKMLLKKILEYGKTQKFDGKNQNNLIGEGGYAKVYIYFYKNKKCAVKVMRKSEFTKAGLQKLKQLEHGSLQQLKDKTQNIIELYDFQEDDQYVYYFLQLCTKGTLNDIVEKSPKKRLSQIESIKIIYQLLQGCLALHQKKIIHRDLKPDNIFVNDKNQVKIGDFGFAKYFDEQNSCNIRCTPVGTQYYSSPQIIESDPYQPSQKWVKFTQKCDIWGIGITFYFLLFGTTPWQSFKKNKNQQISNEKLLKLIKQYPIQKILQPHELLPQTKSFISQCLQYSESSRASYPQLQSHPLFKKIQRQKYLQKYLQKFIQELKYSLHSQQITIQNVLASSQLKLKFNLSFNANKGLSIGQQKISYEKLEKILKYINKSVDGSKCKLFYQIYGEKLTVNYLIKIFTDKQDSKEEETGNLQNLKIEQKEDNINFNKNIKVQQQIGNTGLKQIHEQNPLHGGKKRQN